MISGISSPGGYFPQQSVAKAKSHAPAPAPTQTPAPEIQSEAESAEQLRAPEGDERSLAREFNLFDLATRQFAQILPRLELATVPVD